MFLFKESGVQIAGSSRSAGGSRGRRILMSATESASITTSSEPVELSLKIDSIAINRLIEEVRAGDPIAPAADYNRTYNRHNR